MEKMMLLSQRWKVKPMTAKSRKEEGDNAGLCYFDKYEIEISDKLPPDGAADALMHEGFEAINYMLNLDLTHDQIHRLAPAVLSLIKDNAELIARVQRGTWLPSKGK